jgi:hypothetical protein
MKPAIFSTTSELPSSVIGHFRDRIIYRHDVVQAADVDERIAQGARHLLVDFGNDDLLPFCW